MSYGKYKHVHPSARPVLRPAPPLTPAQRERAARMRAEWREHFNGDDSFIRELVDAGLIHGWRDVISVTPIEDQNHGDD
ncbi:hypothetical protein [Pseudogulbenkiania sp. MAI-1]|uniref:hypothetical protein n=1 Tax=Pseudogulbenkiania sp. MAI-1 TaxID=990370 RepID=UPI00045E8434|nr:hypothetical protein [Pseudogulbenkiania sp. MAI-1]